MLRSILFAAAFAASPAVAQDFQTLEADEIWSTMMGNAYTYPTGAWQEFLPSGRTRYVSGNNSWGLWRVKDGCYCAQWPPAANWTCYEVQSNGDRLRFIDENGIMLDAFPRAG